MMYSVENYDKSRIHVRKHVPKQNQRLEERTIGGS